MARDYRKERRAYYGYGKYEDQTSEQQRHRREKTARNESRAKMKAHGRVRAGQDVHHKNGNALDTRLSNLQATSKHYNRAKNKH